MVLLLRKLYLYFTKDPEGVHYFPGGGPTFPLSPSGSAHGQCHHNGTIFITVPLLNHNCKALMTGEVFQMMHWYCARLTPSRNTALGSGSFCNSAFFSPTYPLPQRSKSNNTGDWLIQSKKDGKDKESIQSSTTPDPVTNSQLDITNERSGQFTNILL